MRLFLVGDVMLGRGIDQILPHPGDPRLHERYVETANDYVRLAEAENGPIPRRQGYEYIWGDALAEIDRRKVDVRIVNLETAVTTCRKPEPKGINYKMHPRDAEALRAFKIDCCSLANNHVLDWGEDGLIETIDSIKRIGIVTTGAGPDQAEAEAPAIVGTGKARVLVFGMATPTCGATGKWGARENRPGICLLNDLSPACVDAIADRIAAARLPHDIIVASLHWGGNWGYEISDDEIAFAHALIDRAGVDIVHGHSSHHAKAIEVYHDKLILYGCGDFMNDYEGIRGYEEFRGDLALAYVASVDSVAGHQLSALTVVPFRIHRFQLQHASVEETFWLQNILSRESARFGARLVASDDRDLTLVWRHHATSTRYNGID